uniref:NADH-ubiquinone oxidoreductase chain 1 n=1 Tax=Amphiascoides atopus TaxID=1352461 RepID=W8DNA9_9MAXI|nr:NADH dehydrogenase subunit 1 [Amphiascoides atopus]AHB52772.1 NADH dehydrogenase subunit 1 [Amphiascoides atopus]
MFFSFISFVILVVAVLINVAFFTLLERKILGLSQFRKGPNKVSYGGVLQPIADAVKLFLKEGAWLEKVNTKVFMLAPGLALGLSLLSWSALPLNILEFDYAFLVLLLVMSLGLYPVLLAGWASNSGYAMVGGLRSVAQTISYEVSLSLIFLSYLVLVCSLNFTAMSELTRTPLVLLTAGIFILWLISGLAETNRTPFDFAEGESELVSGFNVEYGGGGFALIFMAEYSSILFFSAMSSLLLGLGAPMNSGGFMGLLAVGYFWVWARVTLPRYRYDMLMGLAWKGILPLSLAVLSFVISVM